MKKYLLGIIAVVFAVGLSSFTHKAVKAASEDEFYWYYIVEGVLVEPLDGNLHTRTEAKQLNCNDDEGDECLRGFAATQSWPDETPGDAETFSIFKE